jgi:hypothetical protein
MLSTYRMVPRMSGMLVEIPFLVLLNLSLLGGLCAVLTNECNIGVACSRYQSIGMDCILFHVKFECG